jgi:hypothetical protein
MSDPCIYIFEADGVFAMIALYVDDIHMACNNTAWRVAFTALVRSRFDIKDHGDLSDIIGMHITRDRAARTVSLDQGKYVRELLDKHDMVECKPSCLPMDPGFLAAISKQTHVPLTGTDRDIYPSLLGSLQYAVVCTIPDISTALSILGSAHANPSVAHMQALILWSRSAERSFYLPSALSMVASRLVAPIAHATNFGQPSKKSMI